jgi:hypothetical protein
LAACGTGTPAASGTAVPVGAQPVRNGGLVPGSFVDLPKPAGARSYGAPTLSHGAWTQSFEVDGLSPAQTMQFYVTALQGSWGESPPSAPLGRCDPSGGATGSGCTDRAVWIQGSEQLTIIAGPAGVDVGNGTQLSLELTGAQ